VLRLYPVHGWRLNEIKQSAVRDIVTKDSLGERAVEPRHEPDLTAEVAAGCGCSGGQWVPAILTSDAGGPCSRWNAELAESLGLDG